MSVLCTSITVWFGSATKQDRAILQRTIRSAERIIGADLPSIQDLYRSRIRKRAANISADHPHKLFKLLPSGRRYRVPFAKTSHHRDGFFPLAVILKNPLSYQSGFITMHICTTQLSLIKQYLVVFCNVFYLFFIFFTYLCFSLCVYSLFKRFWVFACREQREREPNSLFVCTNLAK